MHNLNIANNKSSLPPINLIIDWVYGRVACKINDTVYDNIRIGNMSAYCEEVLAVAEAACCGEFIAKLPNGYDTVLGENGATLRRYFVRR